MNKFFYLVVFISLGIFLNPLYSQPGKENADKALQKLFQDAWEFRLQENPLFATRVGEYKYDDRLPSVSLEDYERRLAAYENFLDRLHRINRTELTEENQINYDIFEFMVTNDIREIQFKSYLMPITSRSGFHVSFPELSNRMRLQKQKDYQNYISRLRAFYRYTHQYIDLMRTGMESGYVLPKVVLKGVDEVIASIIKNPPEESLFFKPFRKRPSTISDNQWVSLRQQALAAIADSVYPAYRDFLQFVVKEYLPAARSTIAASALPNGRAFYEHRVKYFTTLDISPQEVHEIGLREVRRIRAEMDSIIRSVNFKGDFKAFVQFLRTSPQFYVNTPKDLLKEVAYVLKQMDGKLPELFKTLPRMPYGIRPVPDYIAPRTTTAYYNGPAGDGTRAGFYFVNTYDLKSRPLYEIEALSFHEAVPGHHLQIALQQELDHLPQFRRFFGLTAFVEGWALYAEKLGLDVGFYQDPYSNFGRLTYEMWRASRLVVDTGMHYLGWSREKAIQFMLDNTALTELNIVNEVDRYISWPGQALGYKVGELKISELRKRARQKLGENFDLREFHDVVLSSGSLPLKILEQKVDRWINEQLRANK